MSKITHCLWFKGQAAEAAANCYIKLLPDSRIDRIWRSPVDTPSGPADSVLTVEFTLAGISYLGLNGRSEPNTSDAVSLQVHTVDQAETDRLWTALTADGGEEIACGWLRDRWGMVWQITPVRLMELISDPDSARARRAMEAMMEMVKIDIAALERAADGK